MGRAPRPGVGALRPDPTSSSAASSSSPAQALARSAAMKLSASGEGTRDILREGSHEAVTG